MTHGIRSIARTAISCSLVLACAAALAACSTVPIEKYRSGNPDQRLAFALRRLDSARADGPETNTVLQDERVIVDPGTVRADIEGLATEFPQHVPTLLVNAQLAFEASELEKSQAFCDRILRIDPTNVYAGVLRAQIALADGNVPFARRLVNRQLETSPGSPLLYEVLAGIEFLDGHLAESSAALEHAESLGGEPWRIAYHRGLICERRGEREAAAVYYRGVLSVNPDHESARARLILIEDRP